ncbi:lipase family protein [Falsiroseomonas sp.]|uniref:lipase family protein n=1 Tax=Falsiroseomonas sp. TaxID=2870721 RepID=UPI00356B48CB
MNLTTLGFAVLANAVYFDNQPEVGGFARHLLRREDACGFHAALYVRQAEKGAEFILSFAGSELTEGAVDWQADLGFGGSRVEAGLKVLGAISPIGYVAANMANARAKTLFLSQKNNALSFATLARTMARGRPLCITGHSLGGGLAQMAAAFSGLPAVTFSAPAVTGVDGVRAAFVRQRPKIVNFRIANDPVNVSELAGERIGHTVTLMSPRNVAKAHLMGDTIAELMPQGQFARTGSRQPFTIAEATVNS